MTYLVLPAPQSLDERGVQFSTRWNEIFLVSLALEERASQAVIAMLHRRYDESVALLCASADDHGLQMTIVIWEEYVGSFH